MLTNTFIAMVFVLLYIVVSMFYAYQYIHSYGILPLLYIVVSMFYAYQYIHSYGIRPLLYIVVSMFYAYQYIHSYGIRPPLYCNQQTLQFFYPICPAVSTFLLAENLPPHS